LFFVFTAYSKSGGLKQKKLTGKCGEQHTPLTKYNTNAEQSWFLITRKENFWAGI